MCIMWGAHYTILKEMTYSSLKKNATPRPSQNIALLQVDVSAAHSTVKGELFRLSVALRTDPIPAAALSLALMGAVGPGAPSFRRGSPAGPALRRNAGAGPGGSTQALPAPAVSADLQPEDNFVNLELCAGAAFVGGDCGGAVYYGRSADRPSARELVGVFNSEVYWGCKHDGPNFPGYAAKLDQMTSGRFLSLAKDDASGRHAAAVYYISQARALINTLI